jgi:hypothetical protein
LLKSESGDGGGHRAEVSHVQFIAAFVKGWNKIIQYETLFSDASKQDRRSQKLLTGGKYPSLLNRS